MIFHIVNYYMCMGTTELLNFNYKLSLLQLCRHSLVDLKIVSSNHLSDYTRLKTNCLSKQRHSIVSMTM